MKLKSIKSILSASNLARMGIVALTTTTLAGCLISPYYGQKLSSKSEVVPFTVWTTNKNKSITIECARASAHGGPIDGEDSYQLITTIWPDNQGILDPQGNKIYSASKSKVIPEDCWRYYNYSDAYDYITVIRVLQDGSDNQIYVFDKPGLACLGEWVGKGPNWFNWLNKGCYKTYSNTGGTIRTAFLKSKF